MHKYYNKSFTKYATMHCNVIHELGGHADTIKRILFHYNFGLCKFDFSIVKYSYVRCIPHGDEIRIKTVYM